MPPMSAPQAAPSPVKEMSVTLWCNDLTGMRRFYIQEMGLQETWFHDAVDFGMVCCKGSGFGLMIHRSPEPMETGVIWNAVAADGRGNRRPALSFSYRDEGAYRALVARLKRSGAKSATQNPIWFDNSFWQFYVMDPMGNTLELFWTPTNPPPSTEWSN